MKRAAQSLPLVALLAAQAQAQGTTVGSNSTVTSFFSVCPTASSTTVTLSTTTTICPGPGCAGTTTIFVAKPITTIGTDGRTTIYEEAEFVAPCPCEGGICDATYTVTRDCPCTAPPTAGNVPAGFTATPIACNACAKNGGPSTVTVVTPVANGAYASQTPAMGMAYNGAGAGAWAHAYAYAYASAGTGVGVNGAAAYAQANAVAGAGGAGAMAGADAGAVASGAGAEAHAEAHADAYSSNGGAAAMAEAGAYAEAGAITLPTSNMTMSNYTSSTSPPITSYTGSASRTVYGLSAIAAGVIGGIAFLL